MSAVAAVEYIGATWCKRCHTVLPVVENTCRIVGIPLTVLDYDELEDDDPRKKVVVSLPTIRMQGAIYTANTLEDWKNAVTATAVVTSDQDF